MRLWMRSNIRVPRDPISEIRNPSRNTPVILFALSFMQYYVPHLDTVKRVWHKSRSVETRPLTTNKKFDPKERRSGSCAEIVAIPGTMRSMVWQQHDESIFAAPNWHFSLAAVFRTPAERGRGAEKWVHSWTGFAFLTKMGK